VTQIWVAKGLGGEAGWWVAWLMHEVTMDRNVGEFVARDFVRLPADYVFAHDADSAMRRAWVRFGSYATLIFPQSRPVK
jgi:hypothetical protein